ncbi:sacsin N-terminal ATP-binding-like domain-containing protein [Polaribacter sp. AHE13PA]|uniref:sacsin N-terminal ATP-binding-like domain-containing protein n=1 Tax=Polaribacter sp. AHE13PA TaxID=2745562 RepID=UPI001C4ECEEB|nr:DUF3883 domain-containing protein [Polaribacter sp. AHE13PA]QXP65787.1 DUF3883 domain-containing protein [Polaribacter sp. AHE13PA]
MEGYLNRESILLKAERESELSDLKQHADKMIRGFENFNDFSSNRAIWELVQNACDLSNESKIIIDYSNEGFSFSHNGKPFNTNSLNSLIKQVSGKYGEEEDIPEVGKYGTGFLTTHSFGRTFLINSIMEADGACFELKDFKIDRSPKEWKDLSDKIRIQKKNVYEIIKNGKIVEKPIEFKTTFTYLQETNQENQYVNESSLDLEDYIPLVLTINERLKSLTIIDKKGVDTTFYCENRLPVVNEEGINLYKTVILKNGVSIELYSLMDSDNEIEVILPINKDLELFQFPKRIARLFLYYPLVGSEDFGLNFIINCNKFLPNEPRSGVHLNSNKDQVKDQEEANRKILKIASTLILDFIKSNVLAVKNPMYYADINFKRTSDSPLLNKYFEDLQTLWNKELFYLPLVDSTDDYRNVKDVWFFDEELFSNPSVFDDIYELASMFYDPIPKKEKCEQWTTYLTGWDHDEVDYIDHKELVKHISEEKLEKFNPTNLINYYTSLIEEGKVSFFSDYKLIPNINGEFCFINLLALPSNISDKLIELGNILIPETISDLILNTFKFNFHLESFTRKDFSVKVKNKLDEINAITQICLPEYLDETIYNPIEVIEEKKLEFNFFKAMVDYCKLNNNIESQSRPSKLLRLLSKYYDLEQDLIHLPNVANTEENIDVRSSRKILVKIFFNLLSYHNNNWIQENSELLKEIALCFEDSLKEVYSDSRIYPNQIHELKKASELKRDNNILEEIKNLYNTVNGTEIRKVLAAEGFNQFIAEEDFRNNKYLTTQVEEIFFETDIRNINEHKFKDEIADIISKLNTKLYKELFPRLDDKKANLMLDIVTNENTKDDIFSIVMLKEDKLKKLGLLVKNENFEEILNQAIINLENEKQYKANFQFKHQIGTHMEDKLKEHLKLIFQPEDIKCEVIGEQDGQDIVIKIKGEIKYYIEVKSRWDKRTSIKMSKNQTIRSNEQKNIYSLCSIDMTDYEGEDRYEITDITKILGNIKFVNDIGSHVEHLINVLKQTNEQDEIHLDGDYRTLIPQKVIEGFGVSFTEFETYLIELLKKGI